MRKRLFNVLTLLSLVLFTLLVICTAAHALLSPRSPWLATWKTSTHEYSIGFKAIIQLEVERAEIGWRQGTSGDIRAVSIHPPFWGYGSVDMVGPQNRRFRITSFAIWGTHWLLTMIMPTWWLIRRGRARRMAIAASVSGEQMTLGQTSSDDSQSSRLWFLPMVVGRANR